MANPYVQYPRAPQRRDISLDVIGEAWKIITANLAPFLLVGIIALLGFGGYYAVVMASVTTKMAAIRGGGGDATAGAFDPATLVAGLLFGIFYQFLIMGTYKMGLVAARGGKPTVSDLLSILPKFPQLLGVSILISILGTIGTYLCCIPGFICYGLTMFASLYILDQNMGVFPAFSKSLEVLKPYLWMATLLYFVAALLSGLGAIACGVGMIFTFSILPVSVAIAYRDMNDLPPSVGMPAAQPTGFPPASTGDEFRPPMP